MAAESIALKHQLLIMKRGRRRASVLTPWDRLLLGVCTLLASPGRLNKMAVIVEASTLLRFHQALVKRKYRLLYSPKKRGRPGPKGPSKELIRAVVEMKRRNPRFGCRKIAEQISMAFGIELHRDVVHRILLRFYSPVPGDDGPSWLTVIGHAKDNLWSVDLFRCESILLKSYWIMVVMDVFTRRIIGFGVALAVVDGRPFAGCSIPRSQARDRRNISPQITIHCFGFTGGLRICVSSKSTRSKPSRVRLARRLWSND